MKKRSNELAKRLMEDGEKMNREEFNKLVNKGVFKDTEEDYTRFVVCKHCNYNNHDTNCCTILPEEGTKCPLLLIDYDEVIGDSRQEIDDNLMDYVNNLRQRINYTKGNTNDVNDLVEGLQKAKEE